MFGHERFEAYQLSIRFLKIALPLVENMPHGYAMVKDQLKRAALSVSLNIAEGSGKSSKTDKNRYYEIARGSAMECAAMECAAICDVLELIEHEHYDQALEGKKLLKSIVSILTSVCTK